MLKFTRILLGRQLLMYRRLPQSIFTRYVEILFCGIAYASVYAPISLNATSYRNRVGIIQLTLNLVQLISNSSVVCFRSSLSLFEIERAQSGSTREMPISSVIISYSVVELVFEFFVSIIFTLLTQVASNIKKYFLMVVSFRFSQQVWRALRVFSFAQSSSA
jgi:hypothetical protein